MLRHGSGASPGDGNFDVVWYTPTGRTPHGGGVARFVGGGDDFTILYADTPRLIQAPAVASLMGGGDDFNISYTASGSSGKMLVGASAGSGGNRDNAPLPYAAVPLDRQDRGGGAGQQLERKPMRSWPWPDSPAIPVACQSRTLTLPPPSFRRPCSSSILALPVPRTQAGLGLGHGAAYPSDDRLGASLQSRPLGRNRLPPPTGSREADARPCATRLQAAGGWCMRIVFADMRWICAAMSCGVRAIRFISNPRFSTSCCTWSGIATAWSARTSCSSHLERTHRLRAALSSRINAARKAVGDDGDRQELIKTIHKRGFRFVGEVQEADGELGMPPGQCRMSRGRRTVLRRSCHGSRPRRIHRRAVPRLSCCPLPISALNPTPTTSATG